MDDEMSGPSKGEFERMSQSVCFGSSCVPSGGFSVNSSGNVIDLSSAPAGAATTTVSVTVTGPGGTSPLSSGDVFTYGPVVTAVLPNSGSHLGGTFVTIKGAGFGGASAVLFGTTSVPISPNAINAAGTQITVTAPPGTAGQSVEITVVVGGGDSLPAPQWEFTYA
jgi:hypothetical protein